MDIAYHPITYQLGTFTLSQINWSTLVKEVYAIIMSFCKMAFCPHDAEVIIQSVHAPLQKLIKNKTKNVLTQNWTLEIFSFSPHVTFQHIKGKDNVLADSLSHLQCLGIYEKSPPEKPGEEYDITICEEGETIQEYVQPKDFTPPNPDMVTLVTDSNNEESVINKHTFQVGDDIYEKDLTLIPKPHIQYTPHQIKWFQMKDPSLAIIMNKLQKGTHPNKSLPNMYFLNTDGVLYHCVWEGSQSSEAVVVPKGLYQLVLTMCHDLMWHTATGWSHKKLQICKQDCTKQVHQCKECQHVSLKESCYVDSNLQIPRLPMLFIAMDLLGEYPEMANANCYPLTFFCMITSFVNIIPIKDKKTETVINAYIKYIYANEGRSKFMLSDNGEEFSSDSMA